MASVAEIADEESVPFVDDPSEGVHSLPFGNDIVHSRPAPNVSINDTVPGHRYAPGRVIHITFQHEGRIWLITRGVGIGPNGWENTRITGPILFGKMHADVRVRVGEELRGIRRFDRYPW